MNIEIKDFEDLEGNIHTSLSTTELPIKDLLKLGPVLGRMITMNVKDRTNMMAILKQIYISAGWQIVHDSEGFITEEEDKVSDMLLYGFIEEMEEAGFEKDLFF